MIPLPIADHIVILPLMRAVDDGIAHPDTQEERPAEGIVVLVGPGRVTEQGVRIPPEVAPSDLVSFPGYAGKEVTNPRDLPPGTYLLVRQDELFLNHGPAPADLIPENLK